MKKFLLAAPLSLMLIACGPEEPADYVTTAEINPGMTQTSSDSIDLWALYESLLEGIWEEVCDQWDLIRRIGVNAFCEIYLDANGYPDSGIRRIIARRVCIAKVNRAIDDAVCTVEDWVTGTSSTADGE